MLEGKIVKGIGGFYYVKSDGEIYECRARGIFRKQDIVPMVGDDVKIRLNKEDETTGYVEEILERRNELFRPPVSNVDQAVIVFALRSPDPNLWLLDKFLILAEEQEIDIAICFNKIDLVSDEEKLEYNRIYENAGYRVLNTSTETGEGIECLREVLSGKTTVFAGPSGVGKSTLLNTVQPDLKLQTGSVSEKTSRGKHTTRHVELMSLELGGYVLDTPGFSSLELDFLTEENLEVYFPEIYSKSEDCRFRGCRHNKEPGCAVKSAVEQGEISEKRYENYLLFLKDAMERRKY
ncbi:putative ribosome biogenesis GTPase RsgA [Andreesenia angusta]|uniref:Small ribosomal subunit biogenesis GTPase RsgA n=1 Tax=Andreesenia angusta TaxID=39480 RepID=A0A1S1V7Q9_9FIRM|nr:ribosome small subunit-dependent GTPase A [Andreesenia angusta]OHW62646.1 putative ribosome biogenesis GTPase RsgA [Andreesenia angusta]